MKVVWSRRAIRHLAQVRAYIARDSEQNAALVGERILKAVDALQRQPQIGRPGRVPGTRELIVPRTPFIIPYRIRKHRTGEERLELIAVFRGRRKWPAKL